MALIFDTGPLIAMLDRRDQAHQMTLALLRSSQERRVIPSPVLVEVDYWVSTYMTPSVFVAFLRDISAGAFDVEDLVATDYDRVTQLCETYADSDIGFVDAAVLAVVERFNEDKLVTLDRRHFGMLRPRHVAALRLLPER